jgi:hypothetical protein
VQLDLSSDTRNHGLNRLQEARVSVDNGAGENDLKRLQRKFQATKASFINVDVKERFMQSEARGAGEDAGAAGDARRRARRRCAHDSCVCARPAAHQRRRRATAPASPGLREGTLDVAALEETHKGLEEQLQRDSDALRALKDQNSQVRRSAARGGHWGRRQERPPAAGRRGE